MKSWVPVENALPPTMEVVEASYSNGDGSLIFAMVDDKGRWRLEEDWRIIDAPVLWREVERNIVKSIPQPAQESSEQTIRSLLWENGLLRGIVALARTAVIYQNGEDDQAIVEIDKQLSQLPVRGYDWQERK